MSTVPASPVPLSTLLLLLLILFNYGRAPSFTSYSQDVTCKSYSGFPSIHPSNHLQFLLYPAQGLFGSRASPGNTGSRAGRMHSEWDASPSLGIMRTHSHTYSHFGGKIA